GVAVDRDHGSSGLQKRPGIAARAEGAVDDDLAGSGLERGDDFGEKHRDVAGRSANRGVPSAVASHHPGCSPARPPGFVPCRSCMSLALTCAPCVASFAGSHIWKKLPRPTKATSVVTPVCSRMKS